MKINKLYPYSIIMLMFILPIASVIIERLISEKNFALWDSVGKWFLLWSIGVRLLTAGLKQVVNPWFTLQAIFNINNCESYVVVRELGISNICKGLVGIISFFIPQWRVVGAFMGGLYFGIAGLQHIIKKQDSTNERVAMFSDVFLFIIMTTYILHMIYV